MQQSNEGGRVRSNIGLGETAGAQEARLLDSIADAIVRFDRQWRYVYVNERLCELSGASADQRLGRIFWDVFPELVGTAVEHRYRRAMHEQRADMIELYFPPWDRWLESRLYPVADGLMVWLSDVTERVHAQRALDESQRLFRLLVEGITEYGVYMLDTSGRVSSWNPGAQRLTGYETHEIVGQHFECFATAEDRAAGAPQHELRVAAAEGKFQGEGWRVRKDGTRFWASVVLNAVHDDAGDLMGFAKVLHDLTERLHTERVSEFALRQQQALEDERRRVARALHDDLGHRLAVIAMQVAEALSEPLSDGQRAQLVSVRSLVTETSDAMRRIVADLRPLELEEFGLEAALDMCAERWSKRSQVQVQLTVEGRVDVLPAPMQSTLYSTVQEALSNVARHANASTVDIRLACTADTVRLEIRDDGAGLRPGDQHKSGHYGLIGVTERVRLLDGHVEFGSAPGQGTTLALCLPVPAQADRPHRLDASRPPHRVED